MSLQWDDVTFSAQTEMAHHLAETMGSTADHGFSVIELDDGSQQVVCEDCGPLGGDE